MKITPTQYAQALYEAAENKSHGEVDEALANLVGALAKNNQLKLKDKILERFSDIYNKENKIVEAEVTTREKLGSDIRKHLLTYVSNKYGAKEVILKEKIDEKIKGGIIVKVGDEVLDGSVKRSLEELKKMLSK